MQNVYILWHEYIIHFPKIHRYSLGAKIDTLLIDIIGDVSLAYFTEKKQKLLYVQRAIRNNDTLKILLGISNKISALDDKKYFAILEKIIEIGKMLGGWNNQLISQQEKENSRN